MPPVLPPSWDCCTNGDSHESLPARECQPEPAVKHQVEPECQPSSGVGQSSTYRAVSTFFTWLKRGSAATRGPAMGPRAAGASRLPRTPPHPTHNEMPRNQSKALLTTEPPTRLRSIRPASTTPSRPQLPARSRCTLRVPPHHHRGQGDLDRLDGRPPLLRHRVGGSPWPARVGHIWGTRGLRPAAATVIRPARPGTLTCADTATTHVRSQGSQFRFNV
jgi:hypothetical protein